MGNYIKTIAELEKQNEILEINMMVMGDADGSIFQMIADNEQNIDVLNEIINYAK